MSIRTRLTIAIAAVLLVTITLLGIALVSSTRDTLVDQVDEQVMANAARVQDDPPARTDDGNQSNDNEGSYTPPDRSNATPTSTGDSITDNYERSVAQYHYSPTGELISGKPCGFIDAPKPAPKVPEIPSSELQDLVNRIVTTPSVDGSLSYRMLVQQNSQGDTFVTASPLDGVDSAIDRLVRILVVSGFVALLAAIAACWWIIQRDLRPVDRMVDTAAAIAAGDLSRRVPDADPRTELGRLGGALNEMLGQIESSLEVRTASETRLRRFVADAAHELRTPLTSLRGYAELYRQGALPDETSVSNAMGRIEAEGARMSRLVDDLLLLARMDQQRGIESKTIDVVPVVEEAASDFRAVDPDRPLTVASSGPAIVRGDRIRLRQIIDNLLVNARLHTPPATPVHITVGQHGNEIEIAVRDEGPGISAEDQTRIFERFWRADPARARKTGGSGLGLAIVSSLTEAHGGRITIESEPGAGATFTIHLPAAPIE